MKNTPRNLISLTAAAVAALLLQTSARAFATSVVVQWNDTALESIRQVHPGPPIVARSLAVMHTCGYDAWAAYDREAVGTQLGGTLRRPLAEATEANKAKAVSYASYRALLDLFPQPEQIARIRAFMTSLGYNPDDNSTDVHTPAGIGNRAAAAVLNFRHHDGSNQLGDLHPGAYSDYTGYAPVNTPDQINDPNRWQPLRIPDGHGGFVTQSFIAPQWGRVTPFALRSGDQFRPVPPAKYPSQNYTEQANVVLAYSAALTDEQKTIAEYWADGPLSELPPGHWTLFAEFVSARDHYGIDDDTRMFFALTNAIFDASISSWEAKRFFDYVRPVTAIHFLYTGHPVTAWAGPGQGTQVIDGGTWRPYQAPTVVTPPFPGYLSGHSIFSAAGAQILRLYTNSDVFGFAVTFPAGGGRVEPGLVPHAPLTLSWGTFSDAADEAGISRRFGGIHFRQEDVVSRKIGRLVADQAWAKAISYFHPSTRPQATEVSVFTSLLHREQKALFHHTNALKDFLFGLPVAP